MSILELAQRVVRIANSRSPIEFQSYTDAYDSDFEDVRRRVPDLTRLKSTIDYRPTYDLDAIIRRAGGRRPASRRLVGCVGLLAGSWTSVQHSDALAPICVKLRDQTTHATWTDLTTPPTNGHIA